MLEKREVYISQNEELKLKAMAIKNDLLVRTQIERQYELIKDRITNSDPNTENNTNDQENMSLLDDLEQLKNRCRLIRGPLTVNAVKQEAAFRILSLKIDLSGNINQLIEFVQLFEQSNKAWEIYRCRIDAKDQKDRVSASFEINKMVSGS